MSCNGCSIFNITNEFNASTLTEQECVEVMQCLIDHGTSEQFDAFCNQLGLTLTVSTGPDGVPANATASEALDLCAEETIHFYSPCLLYTSPSPRDRTRSRMPSSA